jgi:ubiquinone/menaquinone biosynthesis C-methylase UbiE
MSFDATVWARRDGLVIGKLFRYRRPPATPAAPEAPEQLDISVRDMSESGWVNQERGELYAHFPIGKDDVVLDVGCGAGGKAAFCARQGAHLILVDVNEATVADALKTLAHEGAASLTPVVSDSDPLPLADGVATRVIASEVLEHVDDPAAVLKELVRVGCPGGLYLITAPDPVSQGLQQHLAPALYFEKPNHIRIIGRDELVRMVTDAGLEIVHQDVHGFYQAMWWNFFWTAGVPLGNRHKLLDAWSETWRALLDTPDGLKVKKVLDGFMPMSQCIVARKPR